MPVTVIPHRFWYNVVTGRTASIYGSTPWISPADKGDWEMVTQGFTTLNPDGTVGCGKPACATHEEARARADRQNAAGFRGMNQD